MNKKAELGNAVINWFIATVLVFGIIITYAVWQKPWQMIDNNLAPQAVSMLLNNGHDFREIQQQARNQQSLVPLIYILGAIVIAVFASIKMNPNYPYQ